MTRREQELLDKQLCWISHSATDQMPILFLFTTFLVCILIGSLTIA